MRDARESFPIPTDNPLQVLRVLKGLKVLQWPLVGAGAAGLATCHAPYLP